MQDFWLNSKTNDAPKSQLMFFAQVLALRMPAVSPLARQCVQNEFTVQPRRTKRMLKIKTLLPVFAMVLVLGLSNAAFAQLSCNVASTPVSRATDTGLTEPAGDLIFNCNGGGTATTTATMTIDYGVPITNNTAYPAAGNTVSGLTGVVRITNATSSSGGAAPTIAAVTNATGQVVMSIPSQAAPLAGTFSFTLTGVLLSLSGSGKTSVAANVSVSPGNNVLITAGQTTAVVITSVLP